MSKATRLGSRVVRALSLDVFEKDSSGETHPAWACRHAADLGLSAPGDGGGSCLHGASEALARSPLFGAWGHAAPMAGGRDHLPHPRCWVLKSSPSPADTENGGYVLTSLGILTFENHVPILPSKI